MIDDLRAGPPGAAGGDGFPGPRTERRRTAAPLPRLLRSELELALLRPRTAVTLTAVLLVPVVVAIALVDGSDDLSHVLAVLVIALSEPAAFALGMPVVLVAADAFATERAQGTLDGLRLSPVGPARLVLVKACAVAGIAVAASAVVACGALLVGSVLLGGGPYGAGAVLGRAGVLAGWMSAQLTGLGLLLLALSAAVRRPVVVVATGLAVLTVAPLVAVVRPAVAPVLPSGQWHEVLAAVTEVPVDAGPMWATTVRAAGFAVAGAGVAVFLLSRRDG